MTTNTVPPGMLPLPVQQVSAAQQLGAFMKAYKTNLVRTIIGALVFLLTAALLCAGGIFPPDLTVTTRGVLLVFGLISLGLALSLASSVIREANLQVYLFQQGMVIDTGKQVQVFPWHQAAIVWQSITRNYRNGRYVGTTYLYTLRRVDGYQVKLNNLTKDIAELGPAIAQGIGNGREFLPWSQVQAVEMKQGRVAVKKTGTSQDWGTDKVAKMPNFLVFTVLADEMLRQAGAGR